MKKKGFIYGMIVVLGGACTCLIGFFIGKNSIPNKLKTLAEMQKLIENEYYYDLDEENLYKAVFYAFGNALDEYSGYLSKTEYKESEGETERFHVKFRTGKDWSFLEEETAYVSLPVVSFSTVAEFSDAMTAFKENGKKNLLLDLRGNGGGDMGAFVKIAAYFCKSGNGERAVAIADYGEKERVFYAEKDRYSEYFAADSRIFVLADGNTASAAECLIGCMLDYGVIEYRDVLLFHRDGEIAKTYGKGIMQSSYRLPDGGVLKLTTARLLFPLSRRCIHGVGIIEADGATAISKKNDDIERIVKGLELS